MPKLTQVKETKRGRYALFFDGEFAFSLDEDTFAMAGLHTGDELEEWQIHDLQTKSDTRKAVDKAMDLLALRDHAAEEDEEENPELANARALVERHYAAKLAQGKWQQVAAALARRGFSHSVIRQALADAETEETEA